MQSSRWLPARDESLKLMHCYHTRERNELGVWVHRRIAAEWRVAPKL